MTSAQKAKITGLGYDENFGGLDLSGCPSLQSLPSEDWTDDRFAQADRTGDGNALKEFIKQQTAEHTPPTTVQSSSREQVRSPPQKSAYSKSRPASRTPIMDKCACRRLSVLELPLPEVHSAPSSGL
jgi:hypothetical protein